MYKIICLIIFHKLYLKHALTNPYLIQPIIHNKNNSRFVVIMLHISTPQLKQKKTNFDRIMKEEEGSGSGSERMKRKPADVIGMLPNYYS